MNPSSLHLSLVRLATRCIPALSIGVALAVSLATTGCDHHAFSPPARSLPLETAAPIGPGMVGIQAEGGEHGAVFGPTIYSGTARVRYGVEEGTEVSGEATLMSVAGTSAVGTSPNIYAGRLGVKHRLWQLRPNRGLTVSVTGGVGGGGSAGGGFVSPDLGAIVSWENRYLVPFFAMRGSLSQPISARPVNTTGTADAGNTYVNTPELTWLASGTLGLRAPLDWMTGSSAVHGALLGGVGWTGLRDPSDSAGFGSVMGGLELTF